MGVPSGSNGKEPVHNEGDSGSIPRSGRPLEKGIAIYSIILAWRIPWTVEPSGLQSIGPKESDMTERLTFALYIHDTNKCKNL